MTTDTVIGQRPHAPTLRSHDTLIFNVDRLQCFLEDSGKGKCQGLVLRNGNWAEVMQLHVNLRLLIK